LLLHLIDIQLNMQILPNYCIFHNHIYLQNYKSLGIKNLSIGSDNQ